MKGALPLLKANNLTIGYKMGSKGIKTIAGPFDLQIEGGKIICLLGPNGAGKSTLIRTLAGLQPLLSGNISIEEKDINELKPRDKARLLSMVLTERVQTGNLTVHSVIALGRFPYTNWLGTLDQSDIEMVQWAMEQTDTLPFAARKLYQLSDGESQKVMLARAIAQDTPVIILDEPTAHLDLPNRVILMRLLHHLARTTGKGILLSTHDLDLALQTADTVWLLSGKGEIKKGAPEDLVLNGTIEETFYKQGVSFDKGSGSFIIHKGGDKKIKLIGNGDQLFWTRRALLRAGFSIDEHVNNTIEIKEEETSTKWIHKHADNITIYQNIHDLLEGLSPIEG